MIRKGITWLILALTIAGCFPSPEIGVRDSIDVPYRAPASKRSIELKTPESFAGSPFGILISPKKNGKIGSCNVTHIGGREILTAVHCIEASSPVKGMQVYYTTRDQEVRKADVSEVVSQTPSDTNDVVVLRLNEAPLDWEVNELSLTELGSAGDTKPEARDVKVSVWSFDYRPVGSTDSFELVKKNCVAHRRVPQLEFTGTAGNSWTASSLPLPRTPVEFYLEGCDSPLRGGHSGSLISLADKPELAVGIYVAERFFDLPTAAEKSISAANYLSGNFRRPLAVNSRIKIFDIGHVLWANPNLN